MGDVYASGTSSDSTEYVISYDSEAGVWKHLADLSLPTTAYPKAVMVPDSFMMSPC